MAKLNCPDFDGFAMCTSQPLSKVASWCRKYLEGLEEVNGTITLSTDLFLRLLRKAYSVDFIYRDLCFSYNCYMYIW